MIRLTPLCRALLLCALCSAAPLTAQDTTRGVRIGLTYDPGTKPGVIVLPSRGTGADSIRAIVQRDLDYGDRVSVIALDAASADQISRGTNSWPILAKLGAAASVQVTPTATGFHLAVYDVTKQVTALVRDYPAPQMTELRAWRAALHGLSDDLEESLTGTRGIAHSRIAFQRDRRLWVVDSDGEQATMVTGDAEPLSVAWNSTGTSLTYNTLIPSSIVVRDIQAGRSRVIASGNGVFASPIFSPDGASVIFAHGVDDGVDIYSAPAEGGSMRRLSVGRGSDNVSPTFSPDGRRIAFTSARAGHPEIYTMDADGTNAEPLTPLAFGENPHRADPDWSPLGQTVAFTSSVSGVFQVMTISLRDRSMKQLTSEGRNEGPSWAADGRHIVFSSDRSGTKQLWVLDVESNRARQLTRTGRQNRNAAWSPRLNPN